ncbi:MAG: acetylglutamate kinase [Gemmatimonadales bacterium]|nr:MAG: acetylglutamate kinase [Gemmatimonadales bacterium]
MNDLRPTIVRLLSNLGSAREIQLYLERFSQVDAVRFAVVKVGGAVLRDELGALVSSLAFLQQVGLTPIVVHGAGPQLDEELAAAGIEKRLVDGLRYTSPEGLAIVRRVLQLQNLRLVEALQAEGVRATSIPTGVFECDLLGRRRYGFVGKVKRVHTSGMKAAIDVGSIPVITSLGETTAGQIVNVNADWAANELVKRIEPYKIIFLTGTGGLLDAEGKIIDSISLVTDHARLMAQPWLHSGMRVKMEQIHDLLMALPPSTSLSITSPDEMAKELFTHRGSGTLVRRGERIRRRASWKSVDRERFAALVESSFGRPLVEDYFERTKPYRVYLSEHYRAAIVLTRENGLIYMDKFAVAEDAKGEGLGRAIWEVMRADTPQLFWRSRRGNAVNEFYFAHADGAVKEGTWTTFWYGMPSWRAVAAAASHTAERPGTLRGAGPGAPAPSPPEREPDHVPERAVPSET